MIAPGDVLGLLWAVGTALNAQPTMRRLGRLSERDPTQMCEGCRARRRSLLHHVAEWEMFGPFGVAFMVLAEASSWWLAPAVPWLRRLAGSAPQPRCVGPRCAAHTLNTR